MTRLGMLALFLILAPSAVSAADVVPDVVYGRKHGMALTFDVYKPEQPNGAGVLFMVSSGWYSRWFPPERGERIFSVLLDAGFTVFCVRHGSSPKFLIPEIYADVRRSVRFIRKNAAEYGVDPERLGAFGGSAGGHLSLLLGTRGDDGDPAAGDPVDRTSSRIAAVVAYFPPVDLRPWVPKVGENGELIDESRSFPALNFHPSLAPDVSPLLHASEDDAPALMIHGAEDRLVPKSESENMHAKLEEHSVATDLIIIEGAGHGFRGEAQKRAAEAMVAWFVKHLGGEKKTKKEKGS